MTFARLSREDEVVLRDTLTQHRPELLPLLDINNWPLALEKRGELDNAINCEVNLIQITSVPFISNRVVWLLGVCLRMRCKLDPEARATLISILEKDAPILIRELGPQVESWSREKQIEVSLLLNHISISYSAQKAASYSSSKLIQLLRIKDYIWISTPLCAKDAAFLQEVIARWAPQLVQIDVHNLESMPLDVYDSITNMLTTELQYIYNNNDDDWKALQVNLLIHYIISVKYEFADRLGIGLTDTHS